ncbi:MAG: hypothetical protein ACK4GQ_04595 [Candidatus Hadarchaeales archaeon]
MGDRKRAGFVLFTWELGEKDRRRRSFYHQLERILSGLPAGSWSKLGGSVYIVNRRYSHEFVALLERFEGPGLVWHKLKVKA